MVKGLKVVLDSYFISRNNREYGSGFICPLLCVDNVNNDVMCIAPGYQKCILLNSTELWLPLEWCNLHILLEGLHGKTLNLDEEWKGCFPDWLCLGSLQCLLPSNMRSLTTMKPLDALLLAV